MIKDDNLWNKCYTIYDKITTDVKIELNSKPVYNKFFLKTKTKFYGDEATESYDKNFPKLESSYACLAVISFDCILMRDGKYHLQAFLKNRIHLKTD